MTKNTVANRLMLSMTTAATSAKAQPLTSTELATAYAELEVKRVQAAAAAEFGYHPMALSEPAWQYITDLLRDAYRVGLAKGEELRMMDINTRYTLKPRR